ncbi:hypothetical protein [Devosia sediminis]|uniref:Uncharacterized protein n=1 Tax=Devosia sediminis TaxID=2798801 RepID=A0A934INN6_9HYPH|nr:hypothetical protein [Devosia sediminis]MBJ3784028.1 hypothetical protein [Devosia sediminis]
MTPRKHPYIFRFTYLHRNGAWIVLDTLSGEAAGKYRSEGEAINAALAATAWTSTPDARFDCRVLELL